MKVKFKGGVRIERITSEYTPVVEIEVEADTIPQAREMAEAQLLEKCATMPVVKSHVDHIDQMVSGMELLSPQPIKCQ